MRCRHLDVNLTSLNKLKKKDTNNAQLLMNGKPQIKTNYIKIITINNYLTTFSAESQYRILYKYL